MDPEFHNVRFLSNFGFVSKHEVSDLFGGFNLRVVCLIYKGLFPGSKVTEMCWCLFSRV